VKRVERFLAVAVSVLLLVGCASEPVPLVTREQSGCLAAPLIGLLVSDSQFGTRVAVANGASEPEPVVVWGPGFAARRQGAEVEVRDPSGAVVAITGRSYSIGGGYVNAGEVGIPGLASSVPVWVVCGEVAPA